MAILGGLFKGAFVRKDRNKKRLHLQKRALLRAIRPFSKQPAIEVDVINSDIKKATSHLLRLENRGESCYLVIDEMIPSSLNDKIKTPCDIEVSLRQQGITVTFTSTILKRIEEDNIPLFYCTLPTKINEKQLRNTYRTPIANFRDVPLKLHTFTGDIIQGYLENVSVDGLGIVANAALSNAFTIGERLDGCYITLPNEEEFKCKIEIKHLDRKRGSKLAIGAKILEIDNKHQTLLQKLILECQRQTLHIDR